MLCTFLLPDNNQQGHEFVYLNLLSQPRLYSTVKWCIWLKNKQYNISVINKYPKGYDYESKLSFSVVHG